MECKKSYKFGIPFSKISTIIKNRTKINFISKENYYFFLTKFLLNIFFFKEISSLLKICLTVYIHLFAK